MKKQPFNQELYNKVVAHTKNAIATSYDALNKHNALEDGIKDLKEGYELTSKLNPKHDMLDDYVIAATQQWVSSGIPAASMSLIWYKCGEDFLKSYVQHFVKAKQ